MKWRHLQLLLFAAAILFGCVNKKDYPLEWPAPAVSKGDDCPDISGRYWNGPDKSSSGTGLRTDNFLFDYITDEGVFGKHKGRDDIVEVRFLDPEKTQLAVWLIEEENTKEWEMLDRAKNEFSCSEGKLIVPYTEFQYWVLHGVVTTGTRTFHLAVDGSLVGNEESKSGGFLFVFVPVGAITRHYNLWNKVSADKIAPDDPMPQRTTSNVSALDRPTLIQEAESGDTEAQLQLYYSVSDDSRLAWLCRAADGKNPIALRRVGILYEFGSEGVPKDKTRAYVWYSLAGDTGYKWASKDASRLLIEMTEEQREKSITLKKEWSLGQCEKNLVNE